MSIHDHGLPRQETTTFRPSAQSPQSQEKDQSIAIARRVMRGGEVLGLAEARIVCRQLLRALALSE